MTTVVTEAPLDVRAVWRRVRLPVILTVVVLAIAAVVAAIENQPPPRPLDPRDASPEGARALAQLLRDRGVAVVAVDADRAPEPTAGTTVVVADPKSLTVARLSALAASPADLVVVDPGDRELGALALTAHVSGSLTEQTVEPGCDLPAAAVAGDARIGGDIYSGTGPILACYPRSFGAALLVGERPGGGRTVVLGSAATLTNSRLDERGDAALALGLLDTNPRLTWLIPRLATNPPADAARKSLTQLLPSRLLWTVLQLFVVVVLVAAWRARRLGPVVVEPLPVIVRAAETVEGRARLLRAARARGDAAAALRDAARDRLADALGLGPGVSRAAVVTAVAGRAGRAGGDVDGLLYGADPPDDAALVRLADDLDALERAVRRS